MRMPMARFRAVRRARSGPRAAALTLLAVLLVGLAAAAPAQASGPRQFTVGTDTQISLQFGGENSPYAPGCYRVEMDRPDPRWNDSILSFYIGAGAWYPGQRGLALNFGWNSYWRTVSVGTTGGVVKEDGLPISGSLAAIEPGAIVTVTRVPTIPIGLPGNPYGWTCAPPAGEQCRDFTVTDEYGAVTYGTLLGNNDSRNVIETLAYAQLKGRFCWQDGKVTRQRIDPIQHDFTSSPIPAGLTFDRKDPRNGNQYATQGGTIYRIDQAGVDIYLDIPKDIKINDVPIPSIGSRKIGSITFDVALNGDGTIDTASATQEWVGALGPGL